MKASEKKVANRKPVVDRPSKYSNGGKFVAAHVDECINNHAKPPVDRKQKEMNSPTETSTYDYNVDTEYK